MRGTCSEGRFWRVLGVVLGGLLALSVGATAGFADQIEAMPEDVVATQNPVVVTRGTGEGVGLHTMSDPHTISVNNMYLDDNGGAQTGEDYGKVTPSSWQAVEGTDITLTVTPASELYTLYEIAVTNANVSAQYVSLYGDTFTMPGFDVTVTAKFCKRHIHDNIEFKPWMSDNSLPDVRLPGDYYLTKDVTLADTWNVPQGGDIPTNLCLNGHKIILNQDGEDWKPVIRVANSDLGAHCKFVLYDEDANKGAITHASGKLGCGVWVVNGGEFVMKGGNISGNDAHNYGGGVYVGKEGQGNAGGTFTLEGGTIANNKGALRGGGVAVQGGTFTMDGGTIQNNGDDGVKYGGGVYVGDGTFNLTGGTITQNTARTGGGVAGEYTYQISVSGSPRVTDNRAYSEHTSAMGDNLCLLWLRSVDGAPITIDGALGEDARIGISMVRDNSPAESLGTNLNYTDGVFTSGYRATQSTDPWNSFTSDNPGLQVLWTPVGTEAQLAEARHITVAQGITGGTVTLSREFAAEDETITVQATPNEGWELVSVAAKDADGTDVAINDSGEFVVPASDVVVTATFKERPALPTGPTNSDPEPTPTPAPTPGPTPTPAPAPEPAPTPAPTPTPEPTPAVTVAKAARPKTVAYVSKSKVAVSWKAAKGAKTYQLQWRRAGAKKWTTKSVKGKSHTVTGLKYGALYEFRVRGVNGKVKGKWSKASLRWLKGTAKVKAAPGKSKGSTKATWKADKAATGGFKVFVYAKKGGKLLATKKAKAGATSATVKGLKSSKTYYIRVRPYRIKSGITYTGVLSGYHSVKAK